MGDIDTNDGPEKTDGFPSDGDEIPIPKSRREQYTGVYTDRWKDVCREIIRAYAQTGVAIYGKPLGPTRLRNKIMERHNVGAGEYLTHDNIRDWLKLEEGQGGHPDDVTFSYIDEFVRIIVIYSSTPFSRYKRVSDINRSKVIIYRGYLALSSITSEFFNGSIHLFRHEVMGFSGYQPFTVSGISMPNPLRLDGTVFLTRWASQIAFPEIATAASDQGTLPLVIQEYEFDLEEGISKNTATSAGDMVFVEMLQDRHVLLDYIRNLTFGYLIW